MGIEVKGSIEITINGTKLTLSLEEAKELQSKLDSAIPKQWAYWPVPYYQTWWWNAQDYTVYTNAGTAMPAQDHGISVTYNSVDGVQVVGNRMLS
jgi:hypothetical protein